MYDVTMDWSMNCLFQILKEGGKEDKDNHLNTTCSICYSHNIQAFDPEIYLLEQGIGQLRFCGT